MTRRKKRDGHSTVFIDKLNSEIKQTQVCIYREFQSNYEENGGQSDVFEKFDQLSLQALCQLLGTFMPIAKLKKDDSYLIGTEVKQMTVRGQKCMVRVGGGYEDIKDYYNNYATKQCVALYHRISSKQSTFNQTIVELLVKHGASPDVIEAYQV